MFTGYLLILLTTSLVYYYSSTGSDAVATDLPLDRWVARQQATSFKTIMKNINPPGTSRGFFAASLSTYKPDYFYTWTRDAALVARVIASIPETNLTVLTDYVDFQISTQMTPTVCNCLGEPKFNTDGSGYTGSWGRPQNDGPAERAIAFIAIANRYHLEGHDPTYITDTLIPAIVKDLDYVASVWQEACFDLWEEIKGVHFYTLMVMRRALLDAIDFFDAYSDTPFRSDHNYKSTAYQIEKRIESFWSSHQNYITSTQDVRNGVQKPSGLDVSTLLAANLLSSRNDGFFTPGSDKVLATAHALEEAFKSIYPLNQQLDEHLGTSIGRYPEDIYDGVGTSVGNPWFIATATYTELYYLAIKEWKQVGVVINDINRSFFYRLFGSSEVSSSFMELQKTHYYAPGSVELDQLIHRATVAADKYFATIQYHQDRNGSMSEQFDRYIGYMAGARDLTWSHAAFISAAKAKSFYPVS
ncbi:glycoside hydrolase family 15 protein [Mucor lusitanicus]|uniref:glucan 1,4-alpha-glucosidase n=1 Tax=Mucor circinelloides f. lusitanicus TaxID=29924 RepID=A0A8H4B914_MUCCL|nr:glycoside hydrolase family 15 protein [Mucor lusitanicus]